MGKHITAIDLGSSKIALATGCSTDSGIRIVSYHEVPSAGIRNGEIINIFHVEQAVSKLIEKAEKDLDEQIGEVILNIGGKFLHRENQSFSVHRPNPMQFITAEEIESLTKARSNTRNASGEILLEASPIKYTIDEYVGIPYGEAVGMSGNDIEAEFLMVFGKETLLNYRRQIMDNCNLAIKKAILSPIAAARAVLTETELENGVVLVDIGKGTTEIVMIKDSTVLDVASIPFAGDSITNDIKNVANVTYKCAEEIKIQRGNCCPEIVPENSRLVIKSQEGIVEGEVDLNLMTNVIEDRLIEIFEAVRHIIDNSRWSGKLASGVVLTGGTAYLENIRQLAQAMLGRNVRLAAPRTAIASDSVEAAFDSYSSVAVGLVLEGFERRLSHTGEMSASKPKAGYQGQKGFGTLFDDDERTRKEEAKRLKEKEKAEKEAAKEAAKEAKKKQKEEEERIKREKKESEKNSRGGGFFGQLFGNTDDNA